MNRSDPSGHFALTLGLMICGIAAIVTAALCAYEQSTHALGDALNSLANTADNAIEKVSEKINAENYTVYFLADENEDIQYVGRVKTDNYGSRMAYHEATRNLYPAYSVSNLSYYEARGLEEIGMIECHTINRSNSRNNQIHGISSTNKKGGLYMDAAINYLLNKAEDMLLNTLGLKTENTQ